MKRHGFPLAVVAALALAAALPPIAAGDDYHNHARLREFLFKQAQDHPALVRVETLAESIEGRAVYLVELGHGGAEEREARPAMLLTAGLEGNQLFGTEMLLGFIEALTAGDETAKLLDTTTIYIIPRLNVDGPESYFTLPQPDGNFSQVLYEMPNSAKPRDDDHDGLIDEDGPSDLNGDRTITWLRVKDPEGEYKLVEGDARLLVKAKPEKGESGEYRLLAEGQDGDQDEEINEDPVGGVNFNHNFPFDYTYFGADAGLHQVSEPETRALADFVVAHPNIGIVFTYSEAENLLATPEKSKESGGRGKALTNLNEDDEPYYSEFGQAFRKALGIEKPLKVNKVPGAFADWMYFHRGRLSLATPGWTPALQVALEKAQKEATKEEDKENKSGDKAEETKEEKPKEDGKKDEDKDEEIEQEIAFLAWIEKNNPGGFRPWVQIVDPDFKGKRCEVGGFAPYVKVTPPAHMLAALKEKHAGYLKDLAGKLPHIGIREFTAKHLGAGVFEVELEVENTGYLPTVLAHGATTREVVPTRVTLALDDENILAGQRITMLKPLAGSGGSEKLRYTIRKPANIERLDVRVVSALAGGADASVVLETKAE